MGRKIGVILGSLVGIIVGVCVGKTVGDIFCCSVGNADGYIVIKHKP